MTRTARRAALLLSMLAALALAVVAAVAPRWAERHEAEPPSDAASESNAPPGAPSGAAFPVPPIAVGLLPSGIPDDCSQDVTAEINAWIAGVPDGSTLTFARNGCYRTESTIRVSNKQDVIFEGNGATFRRTQLTPQNLRYPKHHPHWLVVQSSNLVFRNIRVEGTNTGLEALPQLKGLLPGARRTVDSKGSEAPISCEQEEDGYGCYSRSFAFEHGWHLGEVSDVTLEHAVVDAVWGDGIYIGRDLNDRDGSMNVRVFDVSIDRNGRQGVAIGKASQVLLDAVRVLHSHRSAVDLEPTSPDRSAIEGVEIRNSEFRSRLRALAALGRGGVNDIYYHHNRILDSMELWLESDSGIDVTRFRWRIHSNVHEGLMSQPALRFVATKDVDIRDNHLRFRANNSEQVVQLYEGSQALIACNWFEDAAELVSTDATSSWRGEDNSLNNTPPACLRR
ncbi:MAG: hypothetical protein ABR592_11365 [Nitriliruptorales bacterium]